MIAAEAIRLEVAQHVLIEKDKKAIELCKARWDKPGDVKSLIYSDIKAIAPNEAKAEVQGKLLIRLAVAMNCRKLLWVAGFPCRELSVVNSRRRGLAAGETQLFENTRWLWKALKAEARAVVPPIEVKSERVPKPASAEQLDRFARWSVRTQKGRVAVVKQPPSPTNS